MHHYRLVLVLLAFLAYATGFAQIKAVEQFLSENSEVEKYFIYQSSLRMLNQDGDPDFNKLIRNIRKINVYISEQATDAAVQSYQKMVRSLDAEKFETLVNVKQDAMRLNLMSREEGSRSLYILAASEGQNFAIMEMDGSLDLRYLESLEHLDFGELRRIVGKDEHSEEQQSPHE